MRFRSRALAAGLALGTLLFTSAPASAHVELHAHLFMEEGMTWAFNGDFFGPLQARDWRDVFSSQANPESLNASGLKVVVVSLYAHPLFTMSLRDSIRRQIALTERFVEENPEWIIARTSAEARQAIDSGKRVLVFALEGADGVIENEEDLREFVDEKSIRIVTLLHLTDDQFGGAAFLDGIRALANPWAWFKSLFNRQDREGVRANPVALTEKGRALAAELMRRGVWIDLAHASDAAQRELFPMLERAGQPPIFTHTVCRHHFKAERALAKWQLDEVAKHSGVIGLMPSRTMLKRTTVNESFCPEKPCPAACAASDVRAFATHYTELTKKLPHGAVMTGTDYNGGIEHFAPSKECPTGSSFDEDAGFWNIGQASEIWNATRAVGATVPLDKSRQEVDYFLKAWARFN